LPVGIKIFGLSIFLLKFSALKFFFLKDFSPLVDRRQKEKFINRKSSGQPARKIYVVCLHISAMALFSELCEL